MTRIRMDGFSGMVSTDPYARSYLTTHLYVLAQNSSRLSKARSIICMLSSTALTAIDPVN